MLLCYGHSQAAGAYPINYQVTCRESSFTLTRLAIVEAVSTKSAVALIRLINDTLKAVLAFKFDLQALKFMAPQNPGL